MLLKIDHYFLLLSLNEILKQIIFGMMMRSIFVLYERQLVDFLVYFSLFSLLGSKISNTSWQWDGN